MCPVIPINENDGDDSTKNFGSVVAVNCIDVVLSEEGEPPRVVDDDPELLWRVTDEILVHIPGDLCTAFNGAVMHFAHRKCVAKMRSHHGRCPRCSDAQLRMQFEFPNQNTRYCQNIEGGFAGSSKINAVVRWYKDRVPSGEKVLILSFFKGGLDLLEGVFVEDLGVDCARYDGDFGPAMNKSELNRFKRDPNCRILLATVRSGGVGLNIVEANHVFFLDRWCVFSDSLAYFSNAAFSHDF